MILVYCPAQISQSVMISVQSHPLNVIGIETTAGGREFEITDRYKDNALSFTYMCACTSNPHLQHNHDKQRHHRVSKCGRVTSFSLV